METEGACEMHKRDKEKSEADAQGLGASFKRDNAKIDENTERLHSTTIQTTTSTVKTNQGISSVTRQQNIEVKKVSSSSTILQEDVSYSTNQVITGQNAIRKNSDDILGSDKSMSSSESKIKNRRKHSRYLMM